MPQMPRLLPIERPIGPLPIPEVAIDWQHWERHRRHGHDDDDRISPDLDRLTQEWYAGAEAELLQAYGINYQDGAPYMGMGKTGVTVQSVGRGRYRHVSDKLGLIGQRPSWAAKGLSILVTAMSAPVDSKKRADYLALAGTFAPRARAFRRELLMKPHGQVDPATMDALLMSLNLIGRFRADSAQVSPFITRLKYVDYPEQRLQFAEAHDKINDILLHHAGQWRKKALKLTRLWARGASDKLAHRATKRTEAPIAKSASGSKCHEGERTSQEAADKGISEWGRLWLAGNDDVRDDILQQVINIYESPELGDLPRVVLLPLTGSALRKAALRFRGDTAVGVDGIRPRHYARLSDHALDALAHLLNLFEKTTEVGRVGQGGHRGPKGEQGRWSSLGGARRQPLSAIGACPLR